MVEIDEFERIRAEICDSGPASDGDNLLGMEMECFLLLNREDDDGPAVWEGVKVRRSEGALWLISGRAVGKRADAAAIAATLSAIWDQRLSYRYRSAHTVSKSSESVTLRAVTQIGPGDTWVTAKVHVALT